MQTTSKMTHAETWEHYINLPHRKLERVKHTREYILEMRHRLPMVDADNIQRYADHICELSGGEVTNIQAIKWLHDLGVWLARQDMI